MRQISSAGNFTSGNMSHGKMDLEKPVLKQETFQDKMIRQKPDSYVGVSVFCSYDKAFVQLLLLLAMLSL